jgi:hypothetical protein
VPPVSTVPTMQPHTPAKVKRPLVLDAHVIAYLGDYMNNLKESLRNTISNMTQQQSSQSNTLSSRRKT